MGKTTSGVGISFPNDVRERIAELARLRGTSFSGAVLSLVRDALDRAVPADRIAAIRQEALSRARSELGGELAAATNLRGILEDRLAGLRATLEANERELARLHETYLRDPTVLGDNLEALRVRIRDLDAENEVLRELIADLEIALKRNTEEIARLKESFSQKFAEYFEFAAWPLLSAELNRVCSYFCDFLRWYLTVLSETRDLGGANAHKALRYVLSSLWARLTEIGSPPIVGYAQRQVFSDAFRDPTHLLRLLDSDLPRSVTVSEDDFAEGSSAEDAA